MIKKNVLLFALLLSSFTAQAAFVVEREPEPSYFPDVQPKALRVEQAAPLQEQDVAQSKAQETKGKVSANTNKKEGPVSDKKLEEIKKTISSDISETIHSDLKLNKKDKTIANFDLKKKEKKAAINTKVEPAKEAKPAIEEKVTEEVALVEIKSEVVEVKATEVVTEPLPSWNASAGTTLRQTIESWSSKEAWTVRWEADLLDYPIEADFSMVGKYMEVITKTFELYKDARKPFRVQLYPSQKLVVVQEKK